VTRFSFEKKLGFFQKINCEKSYIFLMPKKWLVRTAQAVGVSILGFSIGVISYSLDRNPQTGRFRLLTTSQEEDVEIGNRISHSLLSSLPRELVLSASHPLTQICQRIADRIALSGDAEKIRFEMVIISDTEKRIASLPNGDIVIHAGLLGNIVSEPELAKLIAREMARTILRHSSEVVTFSDLARIPSGFLYSVGKFHWLAMKMAQPERRLADLPRTERLEKEAEEFADKLLGQAGYSEGSKQDNSELKYWADRISSQL